jgi:hypothetical protein
MFVCTCLKHRCPFVWAIASQMQKRTFSSVLSDLLESPMPYQEVLLPTLVDHNPTASQAASPPSKRRPTSTINVSDDEGVPSAAPEATRPKMKLVLMVDVESNGDQLIWVPNLDDVGVGVDDEYSDDNYRKKTAPSTPTDESHVLEVQQTLVEVAPTEVGSPMSRQTLSPLLELATTEVDSPISRQTLSPLLDDVATTEVASPGSTRPGSPLPDFLETTEAGSQSLAESGSPSSPLRDGVQHFWRHGPSGDAEADWITEQFNAPSTESPTFDSELTENLACGHPDSPVPQPAAASAQHWSIDDIFNEKVDNLLARCWGREWFCGVLPILDQRPIDYDLVFEHARNFIYTIAGADFKIGMTSSPLHRWKRRDCGYEYTDVNWMQILYVSTTSRKAIRDSAGAMENIYEEWMTPVYTNPNKYMAMGRYTPPTTP